MSIEKLNEAIRMRGVNHSRAREAIYTILPESNNVLNISTLLADSYPKRVSLHTIYRHINFFIDNNLVIVLQDNFKLAYRYLKENRRIFPKCNNISKVNIFSKVEDTFKDTEYITIHKKCISCRINDNNFHFKTIIDFALYNNHIEGKDENNNRL